MTINAIGVGTMGLDTSHDAFSAPYSAFNRFRKSVARAIGGSYPDHEDKTLDNDHWYWADDAGPNKYPGLHVFFNHSDCDGEISPSDCALIVDEMQELLPRLDTEEARQRAERFIKGCREAAAAGEPLEFY